MRANHPVIDGVRGFVCCILCLTKIVGVGQSWAADRAIAVRQVKQPMYAVLLIARLCILHPKSLIFCM